jgi:hypothetical protein
MGAILTRFQHNLDGDTLDDLYVVSRCVFGRQQAEHRTSGARDAVDMPLVGTAIRVAGDLYPGRMCRSAVSLKLAVIHTSPSGTTVSSCSPGWTFIPTTTFLVTSPLTGATILV